MADEEMAALGVLDMEADDEYIESLLSRERAHEGATRGSSNYPARADAVRWIMEARSSLGFGLKTAYTAVAYFDQFFEHKAIQLTEDKTWAARLLAVACLSLAAKMEEDRVPAVSEFRIGDCGFSSKAIQRMELLVLNTLEWRMLAVTPFPYLSFFASKFETKTSYLISNSIRFIFAVLEVMNLVYFQPSVVAAAATLAATDQGLTSKSVESKMTSLSSCGLLDSGHVFSCYDLMIQQAKHLGDLGSRKRSSQ